MHHRIISLLATLGLLISSFSPLVSLAVTPPPEKEKSEMAAPGPFVPVVSRSIKNDESPPLSSMVPLPPPSAESGNREIPLRPLPKGQKKSEQPPDPVVQGKMGGANMPAPIRNFDGVNNVNGVLPPDTNGDVGPNHYVQWVNLSFAIYNKTGALLYGPAAGNTLWTGFGGACQTENDGDPIALYDPLANRWFMSQFALPNFPSGPYYQCIAVSTSPDPLGSWYRYAFVASATKMNDYPKFGVWPDGYYMSVNQFTGGASWGGAGAFAFERSKMLLGLSAQMVYFDLGPAHPEFGGQLPSDLDGATPPPAGSPNIFAEVDDSTWIGPNDAMRLWRFHVDWTTPANSTFGVSGQPNSILNTAPWAPLPCVIAGSRDCIPQPGVSSSSYLDAIGDRLMNRLAYRNRGGVQSLVVNHTVNAGSGRAGVRWYEVRSPLSAPTIYQQGTFAPADTLHRWMGSVAMDRQGNMALGYSVSSSAVYPSIRYAGRLVGDPLGTMPQAEATLIAGGGSQTHTASRWGDYSMMAVDPTDDCTFWYTQEYLATTGSAPWRTRVGSFKFPGCTAGPVGYVTGWLRNNLSAPITATVKAVNVANPSLQYETVAYATYSTTLPPATYNIGASAFGHTTVTYTNVAILNTTVTTRNFNLTALPRYTLSGRVFNQSGITLAGVSVSVLNTPLPAATTDANGNYSIANVPSGSYQVRANPNSLFYQSQTQSVSIAGNTTKNFTLASPQDAFGYRLIQAQYDWINGTNRIAISGDDGGGSVPLPFAFNYYGITKTLGSPLYVGTNGLASFSASVASFWTNGGIPSTSAPNAALYPFWDDLYVDTGRAGAGIYTAVVGAAPNRIFVVEWRDVRRFGDGGVNHLTFELLLSEAGGIKFQYKALSGSTAADGSGATVGIENQAGTVALQYSLNATGALRSGLAMAFVRGASPSISAMAPNWGARGYPTRSAITGSNLRSGAVVRLAKAGQSPIPGSALTYVSTGRIDATFTIPAAADLGLWGLVVINPNFDWTTRSRFFDVFVAIDDNSPDITYDSWAGGRNASASGGTWRYSNVANSFSQFTFNAASATTLSWKTLTAPNRGRAQVIIDGVNRGTFDNYSAGVVWGVNRSFSVGAGTHTIKVVNSGAKNASSGGYYVDVDSFQVGATVFQDTHPAVRWNNWLGQSNAAYLGGTARYCGSVGCVAQAIVPGVPGPSGGAWVTATGPNRGIASVMVDSLPKGNVDNYGAGVAYRVLRNIAGLSAGLHKVQIGVTNTKNASSVGYLQFIDAFLLHSTAVAAPTMDDDPAKMSNQPTGPVGSAMAAEATVEAPEIAIP